MNRSSRSGQYPTRRSLLRTAVTAGVALPLLGACVTGGDGDDDPAAGNTGARSAGNPLGVKADIPLEVVIFKGGYGDEYARQAGTLYTGRYPGAQIDIQGLQKIGEALQPRFVSPRPGMSGGR